MKLPKLVYSYRGVDCWFGQYSDYGAMRTGFGINPKIEINLSVCRSPFHLFFCILHEFIHFLIRPLPTRIECLLDLIMDVTWGKHENELVWEIFNVLNGNIELYNCENNSSTK